MLYQSKIYRIPIYLEDEESSRVPVLQAQPSANADVLKRINQINLLGILKVDGYCLIIDGCLCTFILARDIAIGGNLIYENNKNYQHKKINATGGVNSDLGIRWDRFTEYFNDTVEELQMINPDILRFVQPLDPNGYILLEVAAGILNRCNNKIAKQFRGKLLYIAIPYIQQQVLAEYNIEIQQLEYLKEGYYRDKRISEMQLNSQKDAIERQSREIDRLNAMKNVTDDDIVNKISNMSLAQLIELIQNKAR